MPTTTTRAQEHQARWDEIVRDPALQNLPYKVETNNRGQIVLTPRKNRHSIRQEAVQDLLRDHVPDGSTPPGFAIATPEGVKVPDVAWMSEKRWEQMQQTGDPSTLAPEICVEVLSSSNTEEEIREKRELYFEAGAEEVWIVTEDEQIQFFGGEQRERPESGQVQVSGIAPEVPDHL